MTSLSRARQAGFSLVELMIAATLGLMLIGAAVGIVLATARSYREDERLVRLQDEVSFALAALASEIEMAGFWSTVLDPATVNLDSSLTDPGCAPTGAPRWIYTERTRPFQGVDNATAAAANARFPCIDTDEFQPSTDVISLKRLASAPTSTLATNGVYLRTNGVAAVLFKGTAPADAATTPTGTTVDWAYAPVVFYIRNYSENTGDGIPSLCRKVLVGSVFQSPTSGCLAEGIEDLQIEYGVDLDANGTPDRFLSSPSNAEFEKVTAVRLWVLGRSAQPLPGYTNGKTYRLGNGAARTPNDRYYRRVATMTLVVRNPASLRILLGI